LEPEEVVHAIAGISRSWIGNRAVDMRQGQLVVGLFPELVFPEGI